MDGMFGDVFSSTGECLFVDGLFGDVFSSTGECLFVDGMFGDVVSSTGECLFVDGMQKCNRLCNEREKLLHLYGPKYLGL